MKKGKCIYSEIELYKNIKMELKIKGFDDVSYLKLTKFNAPDHVK